MERIGLVESVNRRCPRDGEMSDGTVIAVLVINRLLSPCALSQMDEWVNDTGLHLLLGIGDPKMLNYDRLADALLAVYPHWQTIATEITLRAVEAFQLKVDTVHYDLTSVFFHGEYEGSDWVTFGYSRDKRPDKSTSASVPPPMGRLCFRVVAAFIREIPTMAPRRSRRTNVCTSCSNAATCW